VNPPSNTPLWLADPHITTATLASPITADVVVIGGGLCGTSAALHLAKLGVDVVLLEARTIAQSASGRNAGFILQGTAERYNRAVDLMGRQRAKRIYRWSLENHHRMAETIVQESIDCQYRRRGSLQLAGSKTEEAELKASAALLREDGFEADPISQSMLTPTLVGAGFTMGVHIPADGELHPARFVRGVATAAARHGARLFENTTVTHLDASNVGDVLVTTSHGNVSAAFAVVATNARAGDLLPYFADKVDPVRGQMLATEPCPTLFDHPIYANHGYDYWRQDADNRVILGGWRNLDPDGEVGHDERIHPGIQTQMRAFLDRLSVKAKVSHSWSGIMGFSRDGLPMVGPVPGHPGALAGVGFTGHGFGFGFLAGIALAESIVDGEHPFIKDFDPRRFA
jgi:glycine/D-amino acid oxidase-like deaminating enzyme